MMLPYGRGRTVVVGLLLVDLPVLLLVAVVGWRHGYVHTYEAVSSWRLAHPWSLLPSLALAAVLALRWKRARPPRRP